MARHHLWKFWIVILFGCVTLCCRCFGLLITPGRNVKQSDMHLLDMERHISSNDDTPSLGTHTVVGTWDPTHPHFQLLNSETSKGKVIIGSYLTTYNRREVGNGYWRMVTDGTFSFIAGCTKSVIFWRFRPFYKNKNKMFNVKNIYGIFSC